MQYPNKILLIDLTSRSYKQLILDKRILFEYIGGRGLGIYNLYQEVTPQLNPFNPLSSFIIFCGPMTGKNFFGNNRFGVFFKSPLTGFFAESYSSGLIAENLINLGYLGLIIKGSSNLPSWLLINKNGVEFRSAEDFWGLNISETEKVIRKKVNSKNMGIMSIGIAGENLVRFASIVNDSDNMLSRGGGGAVLGSKNLKSIVIDSVNLKDTNEEIFTDIKNEIIVKMELRRKEYDSLINFGELSFIEKANELGVFPTRYWKFGYSLNIENFNIEKIMNEVLKEKVGCGNCPIECKFLCSASNNPNENKYPLTYEAVNAFGGLCDVSEIKNIVRLNNLCFTYGVDPASLGSNISFAIDVMRSDKFIFSRKTEYGDFDSIYALAEEICNRTKDGHCFSDGLKIAAKKIGIPENLIMIKGLELAGLDPRGLKGTGLSMGICPHGGSYDSIPIHYYELFNTEDRFTLKNKYKKLIDLENKINIANCLLICPLISILEEWNIIQKIISTTLDINYPKKTLELTCDKIINLTRHFNLREGLNQKDDFLPITFYEQPLSRGNSKGQVIDMNEYKEQLKLYYNARGFDESGIPLKKSELDETTITYYF